MESCSAKYQEFFTSIKTFILTKAHNTSTSSVIEEEKKGEGEREIDSLSSNLSNIPLSLTVQPRKSRLFAIQYDLPSLSLLTLAQ